MKTSIIYKFICFGLIGVLLYSCFPEQEVAPITDPSEKPIATITPAGDYSSVNEGDTLIYNITVNKMVTHSVGFVLQVDEASTIDDDDVVIAGGTLGSYSLSTQISVIVVSDALPEGGENFVFSISSEEDLAWNFQLNPDSDVFTGDVKINNFDYSLEWSGTFEEMDMCDWNVDLDIYVANADFSAGNYDGATGACPFEHGTMSSLPDDTYDIYVDYWDGGIENDNGTPDNEDDDFIEYPQIDIPYVASFSNNSGDLFTIEGSFDGEGDVGASTIVGQVVISNGVYTIFDDEGNEIGTM